MTGNTEIELTASGPSARHNRAPSLTTLVFVAAIGSHSSATETRYAFDIDLWDDAGLQSLTCGQLTALVDNPAIENAQRNLRLAALVESWAKEDADDDAVIGPLLDETLRGNPIWFGE